MNGSAHRFVGVGLTPGLKRTETAKNAVPPLRPAALGAGRMGKNAVVGTVSEELQRKNAPLLSNPRCLVPGGASLNFFEPVVEEARFHPYFKELLQEYRNREREEFLRWADGFPDRDGKLAQEFQISFNSVFWEVYLFAVFKAYGFTFDWTHRSPDFLVASDTNRFTVEAVTANAGTGRPNEWEKTYIENFAEFDIDKLNKEAMIRLSNSILAKHRKYMTDYASLPHVQKRPFVLAIGPFEQPFFNHQYNRPIRAVLYDQYVDEPAQMANPERYPSRPPTVRLGTVKKENGSEIELGVFNDGRMREISAIMFSCTATWGKVSALAPEIADSFTMVKSLWGSEPNGVPIQRVGTPAQIGETITDGLQIYHNPYAINPLPTEIFRRKGVIQEHYDAEANMWIQEEVSRSLFFRLVITARSS
jgi:hypothetical protein